ncbi:MAG: sulfite exporter TauE/SafE family protein [Gammaproteobacteria bacterium]|nr:sulfite exporter TauE/SafE family protein [Gammaproteobacteria bacterium]MCK5262588.1 sulfite exporter TauE/SafE family protein [Gammaproteobacteria bacterium]
MVMFDQILIFIISLLANIFSALSGGGAGLIQLPVLIFLGLPFGVAVATHKVATVALGVGATIRHLKESHLERQFSLFIVASGLPGVILGASFILQVPDRMAEIALGILTLGLSIYSFFSPRLGQNYQPTHRNRNGYLLGGITLFIIGILNGSLTSGTGLFVTLWLVQWFGLDYKRAVAYTLILVGLFWNGAGAITLGILGEIHWLWIPALLLGSVIGGYLGAHLAIVKGNTLIKRSFEVVTLLVGLKLVMG